MSKYIDAEKLKKSIGNYVKGAHAALNPIDGDADYYKGKIDACKDMQEVIASLQQEQESIAERFAKVVRGNLIGIDKEVQQKFEQLYFEVTGNKMYGGYND